MKTYKSFGALARAFERAAAGLPDTCAEWTRASALAVANDAKERIGHYQVGWDALAPSTIADKQRHGFIGPLPGGDGGDNPLLRTGKTQDSIIPWSTPTQFIVGSHSDILFWDEFGTKKMPPRPVLAPAMMHIMPFATKVLAKAVRDTIAGEK